MWRIILALTFFAHGIAHLSGLLASWSSGEVGYKNASWIFSSGITLDTPLGKAFGLLWLVAMVGLVGTALGIVRRQTWWPQLAIAASVVSLIVIVPWWNNVPPGAKFGAFFDLLTIVLLSLPTKPWLLELIA
jgi:uncharacterized membrane protein YphA (DoxX/SURF4 family)